MKELEDTKCEVRRVIDLQFSIWDRINTSIEEEGVPPPGSPGYNGCATPLGNFFEDSAYAWLSCGPRLVVINVKNGTSISSWTFRDRVTCVTQFPAQPGQIPLLLVGLDNEASKVRDSCGYLCIFDCTTSQVLRAIRMPAGVEQACVVMGGAEWEDFDDKRIDTVLSESSGMACVALRNLHHLMVDLRRPSWEGPDAETLADESHPAELEFTVQNEKGSTRRRLNREKHAAYNLMNSRLEQYIGFNREEFESTSLYQESLTSALICSRKIGCLVSGCLGRIIIWQTDGAERWISQQLDESMSITHLALLEPTDDPRPYCYLWSAHQEETCRSPAILRMYSMQFERKYTDKGTSSYFNLESNPSVKFELELDENDRITSLCPIVRESNPEQTDNVCRRGEDSLLLINLDAQTLLFDLNQWYKEQMPHAVGECTNPNTIISRYRTHSEIRRMADEIIVNCAYVPETLKEFPCNASSPPEELFFPNSLSFEWINLSTGRLTVWLTRGVQAELLREMSLTGPVIMIEPSETFHRCLAVGLVPSNGEISINPDKDTQREILLSLCLEQRWSKFLLKCAREWSDGSASYLFHAFLRWGMQRASSLKLTADLLCVPLYDQSGTIIGESEIKTLRFYSQQLECITNVVTNLSIESVDLTRERRALRRVSTYLQVLLWFYDVGLLPETQEIEDEARLPISFSLKIPYPYERLATIYREKRQQFDKKSTKNVMKNEEDMFIDELVTRECNSLRSQWEREGGEMSIGGFYPPSSLQSLLRSYLTDCHNSESNEMENKHQITIYFLMDLAMLLQNSCPGVNQLIKYPSAFKLSPSLIKLTQALWLLDHEDYQGFLDTMTGHLVSDSDVKDWHHRLVLRTLMRNNQNKLALIYLRVRKPPLSSLDEQSTVISLSVEHGLVQSAFHRRPPSHYAQLLTSFFRACKNHDRLNDILHLALDHEEEEAFVKFLENEKTEDTRLLYYLQRCRYAEASNVYPSGQSSLRGNHKRNNEKSAPLTIFNAYNATLPEITRKFSANIGYKPLEIDSSSRYARPMSHCKSREKTRDIHEIVMKKARETFLRCDRSRIPFVSAPCASFKSHNGNVETNCVMFVERAKKTHRKRSLDEMRGDDCASLDNEDDRKRRKTSDSVDKGDKIEREIGTSMVFDTPLVKRKNQIINSRNTPIETPHSILKIRQLIRDSRSPSLVRDSPVRVVESRNIERERKPRQIRFSIGQQRCKESPMDESAGDNEEIAKNIAESDVTGDSEETEKSQEKGEISEEENEVEEEAYFSPNVNEKSFNETTILSETSSIGRNVSGPRPRPSLRRSYESKSSDLLRKSLLRTNADSRRSWAPTTSNSPRIMNDSTFDDHKIVPSVSPEAENYSQYLNTTSILSSDTSFEQTLPTEHRALATTKETEKTAGSISDSVYTITEKSVEKCRDISSLASGFGINENFRGFSQVGERKTFNTTSTIEESTIDHKEDKNSEVLMEVDGFGVDFDSSTRSPQKRDNTWEIENERERPEVVGLSAIESMTETAEMEAEEKFAECDMEKEREESGKEEESWEEEKEAEDEEEIRQAEAEEMEKEEKIDENRAQDIEQANSGDPSGNLEEREIFILTVNELEAPEVEINETEMAKTAAENDDDLLALKYDEDEDEENDEIYQSLTNSLDVTPWIAKSLEKSTVLQSDEIYQSLSNFLEFSPSVAKLSEKTIIPRNPEINPSFSNSSEIVPSSVKLSEKSIVQPNDDETLKTSTITTNNNSVYEVRKIMSQESEITDDESSRSSSLSHDSLSTRKHFENTVPEKIQRELIDEASNITDDNSTSSFDSSLFSAKKPSQESLNAKNSLENVNEMSEHDSSHDSSLFSSKRPKNVEENPQRMDRKLVESEKISNVSSSSTGETVTHSATDNAVSEITSESVDEKETASGESSLKESPRPRRGKQSMEMTKIDLMSQKQTKSPRTVPETEITISQRITRSRRGSSVVQEKSPVIASSPAKSAKTPRTRRATSLAKEMFPSSDSTSMMEIEDSQKSVSRLQRSVSLAKESFPIKSLTIEKSPNIDEEKVPIGRRTRRATSMQKETPPPPKKITRSSSKISLSEENIVEEPPVVRKTTRGKRTNNVSNDETTNVTPKRTTRASSLAKEIIEKNESEIPEKNDKKISEKKETEKPEKKVKAKPEKKEKEIPEVSEEVVALTKRPTRKRGSSVPKETRLEINAQASLQRTRRAGSIAREVIPEETSENVDEIKGSKGAREKMTIDRTKSSSPATSTRSRLSSITSIPEEEEDEESEMEIFSSTRGKFNEKRKITRERRAMSADLPLIDAKRRTRAASARSAIIDDPIEEESSELEIPAERKTKSTRKAPTRRKRTTSATSFKEDVDEIFEEKLPVRRARKLSQRSNDSDVFRFSPPDDAHDRPDDDEEMGEVPEYVFSPPQTRSKQTTVAPRREMKDLIPITDEERESEAAKRALKGLVPRRRIASTDQMTISSSCVPRMVFRLPKRSTNTSDEK